MDQTRKTWIAVGVAVAVLAALIGGFVIYGALDDDDDTPPADSTVELSPSPTATSEPASPTPTPETPTPSPSPTPEPPTATATPTPTVEPSPTPTEPPAGPSLLVEHGERGTNRVALTFDMGGRVDPALDIMNFLVDNDVHATIFITGQAIERTDEGKEVLAIVEEHPELFILGNHSNSHPDFTTLSREEMLAELQTTNEQISTHSSLDPHPWFRPPFGAWDDDVLADVSEAGFSYTVMWDVDTIDWRPEADGGPTADDMTAKVLDNVQGGSIVLMHLGGYNTLDALPGMVQGLRDAGFEPVTLEEMFGP